MNLTICPNVVRFKDLEQQAYLLCYLLPTMIAVSKHVVDTYDLRVWAVKLARACRAEGWNPPQWLKEMIK